MLPSQFPTHDSTWMETRGVSVTLSHTPGSLQAVLTKPTVSLDSQEELALACPVSRVTLENTSNTGKFQIVIKKVCWVIALGTGGPGWAVLSNGCLNLLVPVRKLSL